MESKPYKLRFLPLFEEDLTQIVDYMAVQLGNPAAAERFVDAVQQAIRERTHCANAFEAYHSVREREHPYYRIYVKNYIVLYVLIGDVMEVRRILYNRRNIKAQI